MFKIYQGMYKTLKNINSNIPDDMMFNSKNVDEIINKIELKLIYFSPSGFIHTFISSASCPTWKVEEKFVIPR